MLVFVQELFSIFKTSWTYDIFSYSYKMWNMRAKLLRLGLYNDWFEHLFRAEQPRALPGADPQVHALLHLGQHGSLLLHRQVQRRSAHWSGRRNKYYI